MEDPPLLVLSGVVPCTLGFEEIDAENHWFPWEHDLALLVYITGARLNTLQCCEWTLTGMSGRHLLIYYEEA